MDEGLVNKNPENAAFQSGDVLSTAPPPPSEVKVRTMRSDIESMAKSGGGMPSFANVKVSGLSAQKVSGAAVVRAQSKSNFLVIILVVIVIAVLAVAGWFAYTFFLNGRQTGQTSQSQQSSQPTQTTAAVGTTTQPAPNQGTVPILDLGATATGTATPAATAPFIHASFFKTPADQILKLTLSSTSTPQTYDKQLLALLATANKSASVIEIDAKDPNGSAASVNELLAAQNAEVLNPLTLASDFNPDATFFVYRDSNGFWPGYIIGLAPGQSSVAVQGSIQQTIESPADESNVENLFLSAGIGMPSADGFTDSIIGSSTVRVLPFFGGTIPAYFVYGWTPDSQYVILSASQDGFAAALARLGY